MSASTSDHSDAARSRGNSMNSTAQQSSGADDPSAARLRRAWRSLASNLVVAARAAEKVAKAGGVDEAPTKDKKSMDDSIDHVLRARTDISRQAALCEAKLRGNAREMEALECSMKSTSSAGIKRKRKEMPGEEEFI